MSEAIEIDRKALLESLGGEEAAKSLDSEAKADALEHHMMMLMNLEPPGGANGPGGEEKYPTVAEVEARIETRYWRRGGGQPFRFAFGQRKKTAAAAGETDVV